MTFPDKINIISYFYSIYRFLTKILDLLPLHRNMCTKKFADLCLASVDFSFISNFNWFSETKVPFSPYDLVLKLCTRKVFNSSTIISRYDFIFVDLNMHKSVFL